MGEVWVSGGLSERARGSVSEDLRSQGACLGVFFPTHFLIQVGDGVEPPGGILYYSSLRRYSVPYLVSERLRTRDKARKD